MLIEINPLFMKLRELLEQLESDEEYCSDLCNKYPQLVNEKVTNGAKKASKIISQFL